MKNHVLLLIALFFFSCILPACRQSTDESNTESDSHDTATPDDEGAKATATSAAGTKGTESGQLPKFDVLSKDELAEGWIRLFDGETLFGWEASTNANWHIENGTITADQGERGLLCTTVDFADYVLRVDFKAHPQSNSGIFLRTPLKSSDPKTNCYELNIAPDDNAYPTGSLVFRRKVHGNNSEEWQTFEATVLGNEITIRLNGEQIVHYVDKSPLSKGRIGLQLNEGHIAFRNIFLKPLSLKPLFDGKTLDGWKTYPDMDSEFSVTDEGLLHVENGRGQLETTESYGDFVLQLECRTNAPYLNSGIFFRCIPGELMNGYESQIQNQFKKDRRDPVDCGTGGIFRRVNARFVAADDDTWFSKTIVASGPRFGVWVNGVQVTAWTDDREEDENPRRGLRTKPGTIMVQGHDPTTDIDFRNLRIVPLPE
ncbi:MAG: DUF1080 domain-containing protein [Pirellulaceae bacterium]